MFQARVPSAGGTVAGGFGRSARTLGRAVHLGVRSGALILGGSARLCFPLRESVVQAWFFVSVSLLPAVLISLPMGVVIACQRGLEVSGGPKGVADGVNASVILGCLLVNLAFTQIVLLFAPLRFL